ncbi:MAG: hypothetical protein ACYC19_03705 [Acidimicrobiales bacterium]
MSRDRRSPGWIRLSTGVVVVSLLIASSSAASTTWLWRATGTLGVHQNCSQFGERLSKLVCGFHVANAPQQNFRETVLVRFTNTTTHTKCFAVSISTSYMAGLRSVCVKAKKSGRIARSGPARQYRSTHVSVFVTSGSTTKPIAPLRDSTTSPFLIEFSQSGS